MLKPLRIVSTSLMVLFLMAQAPSAQAFFCTQPTVAIEWCGESTFKIEGDGFSRGNFTLVNPGDDGMLEFSQTEFRDALEATFSIKGLAPGTTTIEVAWEFTDESDNGVCAAEVEVGDYTVGADAAIEIMNGVFTDRNITADDAWVFMQQTPLTAGATISDGDPLGRSDNWLEPGDNAQVAYNDESGGLEVTAQATWFAWVDYGKDDRFASYSEFYLVDAKTGNLEQYSSDFWPVVNGEPYLPGLQDRLDSPDRVFGDNPPAISVTDDNTISTPEEPAPPKEDVCAVLVTGTATNPRQIQSFDTDVEFMRSNLIGEKLGERINPENITTLKNASRETITSTIEGFKGTYRKVYFYYSGHGSERYMVTNDEVGSRMWYTDLVEALDKSEADEICVIIDACHSGGAIEEFSGSSVLKDQNVTLVTSCRKDTTSWTRYIPLSSGDTVRTGEYTWAFVQCYGAPGADHNKDNMVNIREAHLWARSQNPTLDVGGSLTGRMDPQEYHHRAVKPAVEPVTVVPDAGVTVETDENSNIPNDAELRLDLHFDVPEIGEIDESVINISPKVRWNMEWGVALENYDMSLKFDYGYLNEKFTGEGVPGVVYRTDNRDTWTAWTPSEVNEVDLTVTALDVTKLGQFAVGEVKPQDPNSVAERAAELGFVLNTISPNPAREFLGVNWSLEHAGTIKLTIVDLGGREVFNTSARTFAAGEHNQRFELPDGLSQGQYFLRVRYHKSGEFPVALSQGFSLMRP